MKIVDLHCDTISRLYYEKGVKEQSKLRKNALHIDLEKLSEGDYLLQNFAVYVPLKEVKDPFETAMKMMDRYYLELEENRDQISPVYRYPDIARNSAHKKISSLLTIEEGGVFKGELEFIRMFYRLGVRMVALTWNYENEIGAPNIVYGEGGRPEYQKRSGKGLTEFGVMAVQEMERLGMIVDVSHLSDGGFWDVIKHTAKPFVASHSNAAAICNVSRNLTDDMIRALAERGGVMGINFFENFLREGAAAESTKHPCGRIADMIAHVKHITNIGGIEVCAIGSDFDGIRGNPEIQNAAQMQNFVTALRKAGFTWRESEQICYKNALRIYQEVL